MKKKVAVLGASGSIGKNTLDVLRSHRDDFEPVLFSSHKNITELLSLSKEFPKAALALSLDGAETADGKTAYTGKAGLLRAIGECGADIVVNGIAGASGLEPSLAALKTGALLALANKETIVMAAPLAFALAEKNHTKIIPVDSEHSAVFNLLEAHGASFEELILTASGGPFRNYSTQELERIGPKEALNHPTWNMGPKITIDSASLANKGLEVIEAAGLFNARPEQIKVVIHPQSVVHSMIRLKDGAVYAELSKPDMRLPIHNALYYPECKPCPFGRLDFDHLTLDFEKPDFEKFPMLSLAYNAAEKGGVYPAVYNAANEIAVTAFLKNSVRFVDIPHIAEYVLNKYRNTENGFSGDFTDESVLDYILEQDKYARFLAEDFIREHKR